MKGELSVHEFWDTEIWTTERFQQQLFSGKGIP